MIDGMEWKFQADKMSRSKRGLFATYKFNSLVVNFSFHWIKLSNVVHYVGKWHQTEEVGKNTNKRKKRSIPERKTQSLARKTLGGVRVDFNNASISFLDVVQVMPTKIQTFSISIPLISPSYC